jgi:two-component system, cell cycle response regulator
MPSQLPARRASTPPLPASFLAIQIIQGAAKPNVTVQELAAMCENDPGFVVRALAYVNSAGHSLTRRVTSVQHAVALLGIRGTRNLALGMCVMELTPGGQEGSVLLSICLRRAVIAKLLAEALKRPNPDDYFTMGMLLEIGLLVKARTDLASAVNFASAAANTRITLERAAGQEDHAKLGSRLARSWQLGEEISKALLFHHSRTPTASPFSELAWLTELAAGVFENGDAVQSRTQLVEAAASLEIPAKLVDDVLQATPEAVALAAQRFGRDIGPQPSVDSLLRDTNEAMGELSRNYAEVVAKLESLLLEKEQLVKALKGADEKLATTALTDTVSGLPNQRAFRDALNRDLARADRSRTHVGLIVLEIDNFRQLSELAGPAAIDQALGIVAEVLLSCVRVSDVLARLNADTFAMLLPTTNLQGALVVAERACKRLADNSFSTASGSFHITVSVGVAATMGPHCRDQSDALLAAAENGLSMAKSAGRNRVMVGSL